MPVPFDQQARARYVNLIERGRMPKLAAEDIGFSWATVQKHLRADPDFAAAVSEASQRVDERVEEVVLDLALEGNLAAAKMWLQERQRGRWMDTRQMQVTGAGGGPIQIATGSVDTLRVLVESPDSRQEMLATLRQIPALGDGVIETTVVEDG